MRRGRALLLCWVLFPLVAHAGKLISQGDSWRYFKGNAYPGAAWNTVGFDDSVWLTGPSGFGYGDNDDATVLGDMQSNYLTVFTRKTFVITNAASIATLTLSADFDDGFVAWLNGTEIIRRNVAAGAITNTTPAAGNHEASRGDSSPQPVEFFPLNPALLVEGTNVLAVSSHNVSLTSSDLSLIIEVYTNEIHLTRGPFIQMPVSNQVTIVWRTDAATDSVVDYGLDTNYGGSISDSSPVTEHVVNIPGLLPNTNYYYRVRSGGVTLTPDGYFFRTKRVGTQPFRFVVLGDFGAGTAGMSNVAAQINARDFDLFLTVGDNIYPSGQPESFDPYWFSLYGPTMRRVPCFPVLGNHDVMTSNGQPLLDAFYLPTNGPVTEVERNYSFDYGSVHFAAVDVNVFTPTPDFTKIAAIKSWLSNDLAATAQPWKIVYFHHPPYTSTGGHDDDESVKTNLMPVVEGGGAQLVFNGHQHWYERMNAIRGVYHVTTGAGGQSLYAPTSREPYSAVLRNDVYSFTLGEVTGSRLKLQQISDAGVVIDEFNLDLSHPFRIDGLLDDPAWLRADNGLKLYAAIRGNYLYVATLDAGEGNDHFIYLNNQISTNRPANWAKAGQVMQWNALLADENDGAFQGWFDSTEAQRTNFPAFQSMTSGLNNNDPTGNGVLEGTVDILERFGSFPPVLYLQAAAYQTADGGSRVVDAPAGQFLVVNTRDLALDLPVANAGTNYTLEAGLPAVLNGTGSSAPSGLPLAFNWIQIAGDPVALINSNSAAAGFTPLSAGARTFQLTVSDTRFTSNATVTVTAIAPIDTDGDGLTDQEELTGQDNILTVPIPAALTNPYNPDTDGDGQSDGAEALAGTNPNDPGSALKIVRITGQCLVEWTTVAGKTYQVQTNSTPVGAWQPFTNLTATFTGTTNVVDLSAGAVTNRFYRVVVP